MRNSSYIIPSKTIESYLITRNKAQVKKLSLTSGASWIHSPAEEFMRGQEIHSVADNNRDLLNIGHAFWLSTIRDINPENRTVVNEALTEKLNTLNSILESGINQGSMASIEAPLSELEESLKNSPNHVKIGLLNKIQTQIEKEINSNQQAHLNQQKALLETIIQDRPPTADSAQEQASQETINKAYSTLQNLFNRKKCINLLENTLPVMLKHSTGSFTDLLGYCTLCLEESNGKYSDPEKIDTLIGLLVECALAYRDGASCTAGIRERCQRDGYFIKSSLDATRASTSNTVDLLRQIREHYAENKLMATSDEPSPLLGLLIMDTILKKHGITTWSVCGKEENRRKLENLSPTSWQALQDHLGTEKAKLTAELAELNETNSMNQEDKASQKETGLAKVNRLKQKQTVTHKLAVLETQLDTLHGIELSRNHNIDSSVENNQLSSNVNSKPKGKSISISVEESLVTLNNLIQKRTLLDLTKLAPETKQALQDECDALGEMIDKMTSAYEPKQAFQNQNIAVFTQYHQAMIEDLTNTLSGYGLTYEHSRTVILTACLTKDFNKLNDSNIPAQYSYWALAYQQATGYLNTTAQHSIPTTSGIYEPNEDYQKNIQAKVVAEWLTPLHAMQNKLLLQEPEELVATLSNKAKVLVLPATCQDQEQADAILAFMQNPVIMAHYLNNDTTLLSGLGGNDLVLETLFNQQIAEESPDWSTIQDTFFHIVQGCTTNTADKVITTLHNKHPETLSSHNREQQTALGLALMHRRVDIAHKLIDILSTASIEALTCRDEEGKTPLHLAIKNDYTDIAHKLIDILKTKSIEALSTKGSAGYTPLHLAIEKGHTDIAHNLIDILATHRIEALTCPDIVGITPLHQAINKGKTDIAHKLIDILVKHSISTLTCPDIHHYTPLHMAIRNGHTDIAHNLIDILATQRIEALTCPDENGMTPLYLAINKGNKDIAHKLIDILATQRIEALTCRDKYGITPLYLAINSGNKDIAHKLIDILKTKSIGALNTKGRSGDTPLHQAINSGNKDIAHKLIDILKTKSIEALTCRDKEGKTPLHLAIEKGHTDIAEQLIGILVTQSIEAITCPIIWGITPLHLAIINGHTDIAHKLIDILEKKDIEALTCLDKHGKTPLYLAINSGNKDIAEKLIDILSTHSIEALTYPTKEGNTPLHLAIKNGHTDIAHNLIDILKTKSIEALTCPDKEDNTPLHLAIRNGHTDIAKQLIGILSTQRIDALSSTKGRYGDKPLHLAIKNGHTDIAKQLIDILAEHNIETLTYLDEYYGTPLHLAIKESNTDIAKKLIDILEKHSIKALSTQDIYGDTPLHLAIKKGHTDIAKQLIGILSTQRIDALSTQGKVRCTPLHIAIDKGHTDIIHNLIDILAEHNIRTLNYADKYSDTPLHIAIDKGHTDIAHKLIGILVKHSIDTLTDSDIDHNTPLHLAIISGHTDIAHNLIDILVEYSIETLTCPNKYGHTPLHLAIIYSRTDIAHKLIDILATQRIEALTYIYYNNHTPLHLAIEHGNTDITTRLIDVLKERPETFSIENHAKETPFELLIRQGDTEIAYQLIEGWLQSNPDAIIEKNFLTKAVMIGQATMVQKIIDALIEKTPDKLREKINDIIQILTMAPVLNLNLPNHQQMNDLLKISLEKIAEKQPHAETSASNQGLFQPQPDSISREITEEKPENPADTGQENQPNRGGEGKARPSI